MEFNEIMVKECPGVCRCCLSEGCYKDLGTEYTWMNDTEVYAEMLLDCFDISISKHSDGPNGSNRLICEVCITRLRDACNFKKQVLDSEKKFIDMVARGEFQPKMVIYEAPVKSENISMIGVEGEEEPMQEAEVEFLEDDLDYDEVEQMKEEPSGSSIVVPPLIKSKRGRPKKSDKPEKKSKLVKTEEKAKSSKVVAKDDPTFTSQKRRENLEILFNNTSIIPFKWRGKYQCFYCGICSDYPEIKKHIKSHGPVATSDPCLKSLKGSYIEIKIDVSEIICEICNDSFSKFEDVIDHLIVKHNRGYDKSINTSLQEYRLSDLKCLECEEQFSYFGYLVNHVNNMHPRNCFICDECKCKFNKKRDLTVHFRNRHRQGDYPCNVCILNFKTRYSLQAHINSTHCRQCGSCGLKFASLTLLQNHLRTEHLDVEGNVNCGLCSREYKSKRALRQHLIQCKKKLTTENGPNITDDNIEAVKQNLLKIRQNILYITNMSTACPFKFFSKFTCFYCSKKFEDFEDLRHHTKSEHPVTDLKTKSIKRCKGKRIGIKIDITNLTCKICSLPMSGLDVLIDHLIAAHSATYDKSVKNCFEPYKIIKDSIPCPICPDKKFRYFGILLRHMNSEHINSNPMICDFCGKNFRNLPNLKVHISYAHTGACECDICGTKHKNQMCLSRHKAKSHNFKDYKCPKCPDLFLSQYQKQKHLIEVHNVGHKCSYCDKMFTRNSFMKDHIRRTHLKEKNVPCSVCNERFFDNYLLRLHMVKHKGERKFSCTICSKAFLRKTNLNVHMDMHKKYGHVEIQT